MSDGSEFSKLDYNLRRALIDAQVEGDLAKEREAQRNIEIVNQLKRELGR